MKKSMALFAAMTVILSLTSCGGNVDIDYSRSNIYSRDDMDAAITLIRDEFSTWNGCKLHRISYSSDECNSEKNIEWMNNLGNDNMEFTQCIEFGSDFHSPKFGGGGWNADSEYRNWEWWLARTDGGEWNLMTWGYA